MPDMLKAVLGVVVVLLVGARASGQQLQTLWDLPANRAAVVSTQPEGGAPGGAERPAEPRVVHTAGGGSKTSGGDPTTPGRAQEVGNRHRGKLELKSFYEYGDDGFRWTTEDDEYSLGIRGMSQLDTRVYSQPTPGFTSSGFYNPRTRLYFEGHFSQPIQYEVSLQNTFDSVALLDAYVNFNYD
ncbi:MAG: hypothetical protein J0H57_25840, partial [Rhodospirillales bacterium]|nr:hypothetical protein [Rhodospirillales bacterium]